MILLVLPWNGRLRVLTIAPLALLGAKLVLMAQETVKIGQLDRKDQQMGNFDTRQLVSYDILHFDVYTHSKEID